MAMKTVLPALAMTLMVAGAACGSPGGGAQPRIPSDAAAALADRADQVATALEGGACDDALAQARSLQTDIAALSLEPAVRAEALAGAARLVGSISCPPPVVTSTSSTPVVTVPDFGSTGKGGKSKGHKDDGNDD